MFSLNEQGNADRFVDRWGDLIRYSPGMGWLVWSGGKFDRSKEKAHHLASLTLREMDREVEEDWPEEQEAALQKWMFSCQSAKRIEAVLQISCSRPEVLADPSLFDSHPWLFNCKDGILDLETGERIPASPTFHFTQIANAKIDPEAKCPRWEQFMTEISLGDEDLARTLQLAVGSSMVGLPNARVLMFLFGCGANGKSVFLDTLAHVFGDYSGHIMAEKLTDRSSNNVTSDLAYIRGRRMITTSELDPGVQLSTSLVKSLTGDARVTARHLYQEPFTYEPSYKFWIATNHMPSLKRVDQGIRDRIVQVPFRMQLTKDQQDPELFERLKGETDGILQWALEGCIQWQGRKKRIPLAESILVATSEYFDDEDHVRRFLTECTTPAEEERVSGKDMYQTYRAWSDAEGARPMRHIAFSKALREHSIGYKRWGNGSWWYGLELNPNAPRPEKKRDLWS